MENIKDKITNQGDKRFWRIVLLCSTLMMLSPVGYLGCHEMTLRDICLPGKKVRSQNNLVVCRNPHSGKEWIRSVD